MASPHEESSRAQNSNRDPTYIICYDYILLFRCCITYLDRSRNIIRFFDMPWILTTATFYYGCLQSSYICGHKAGCCTWCFANRDP
ncbi:uncharacterized protein LOC143303303 isoform X2 [Bombus vancouverensis nearcticus]|uniref:uncharacterized protein LOC143303303 isoform X2 n=1 Tax=Bombus vancouverensis nearcticus TaxID=2705178 RepID=UPI00402B5496